MRICVLVVPLLLWVDPHDCYGVVSLHRVVVERVLLPLVHKSCTAAVGHITQGLQVGSARMRCWYALHVLISPCLLLPGAVGQGANLSVRTPVLAEPQRRSPRRPSRVHWAHLPAFARQRCVSCTAAVLSPSSVTHIARCAPDSVLSAAATLVLAVPYARRGASFGCTKASRGQQPTRHPLTAVHRCGHSYSRHRTGWGHGILYAQQSSAQRCQALPFTSCAWQRLSQSHVPTRPALCGDCGGVCSSYLDTLYRIHSGTVGRYGCLNLVCLCFYACIVVLCMR